MDVLIGLLSIGEVLTLVGLLIAWLTFRRHTTKDGLEQAADRARQEERLVSLSEKLDRLGEGMDGLSKISTRLTSVEERLRALERRIDSIERKVC